MAEFKRLSEVEQIDVASDNATVLIEEGGEIKRVPKSAVGGAGGYVVTFTESNIPIFEEYTLVCTDNYDDMYDVLMAGGSVYFDMTALTFSGPAPSALTSASDIPSPSAFDGHKVAVLEWMLSDIGLLAMVSSAVMNGIVTVIFPIGSHNLESNSSGDK